MQYHILAGIIVPPSHSTTYTFIPGLLCLARISFSLPRLTLNLLERAVCGFMRMRVGIRVETGRGSDKNFVVLTE